MCKEKEMYVHVKTDSIGSECSESMGISESDWNELSEREQQDCIEDFIKSITEQE